MPKGQCQVGNDYTGGTGRINSALPRPPPNHVPRCHMDASFKSLQGWLLNQCTGQPVPGSDNPFGEEIFPNNQSKPTLGCSFEAISSCLSYVTWHTGALSIAAGQEAGKGQRKQHVQDFRTLEEQGWVLHPPAPSYSTQLPPQGVITHTTASGIWTKSQLSTQLHFLLPDFIAQHLPPSPLPLWG